MPDIPMVGHYWSKSTKFFPGATVESMAELSELLDAGRWVYLRDVPKHPSFMISMTYRTLKLFVNGCEIRVAERFQEVKDG